MLLRQNGYRTGFVGKFGVGPPDKQPAGHFDYWRGFSDQAPYHTTGSSEHLTKRMGDDAIEFLRSVRNTGSDQPFCLSVSWKAPHAEDGAQREFAPDARDADLFAAVEMPPPENASREIFERLPEFVRRSEGRTRWQRRFSTPELFQQNVKDYYRLFVGIDREVGRILAILREIEADKNTVIIFTSDNGFFLGERGMSDKWLPYEEAIRVPLIVRDPRLSTASLGKTSDELALNIDLAPTILDYAGIPSTPEMQGVSLPRIVETKRPRGGEVTSSTNTPRYRASFRRRKECDESVEIHSVHRRDSSRRGNCITSRRTHGRNATSSVTLYTARWRKDCAAGATNSAKNCGSDGRGH